MTHDDPIVRYKCNFALTTMTFIDNPKIIRDIVERGLFDQIYNAY